MGRASVKTLGMAWAIIGLLSMLVAQAEQGLDFAFRDRLFDVGLVLSVLAVIVYIAGWLLRPSIGEIIRAERLVKENHATLQAYLEGTDKDDSEAYWRD